jgi:hypothetical protein
VSRIVDRKARIINGFPMVVLTRSGYVHSITLEPFQHGFPCRLLVGNADNPHRREADAHRPTPARLAQARGAVRRRLICSRTMPAL